MATTKKPPKVLRADVVDNALKGIVAGLQSAAVPVGSYENHLRSADEASRRQAPQPKAKPEPQPKARPEEPTQEANAAARAEMARRAAEAEPKRIPDAARVLPAERIGADTASAKPAPSRDSILLQLVERVKAAEGAADNLRDKIAQERVGHDQRIKLLEENLALRDMEIEDLKGDVQALEEQVKQAWSAQAEAKKSEFNDEEEAALLSLGIPVR